MCEQPKLSQPFDPILGIATAAGLGYLPWAPGTVGALVGVAVSYGVYQLPSVRWQVAVMTILLAIGVPVCSYAGRKLGQADPKEVIWDEVATVPWVFFLIPAGEVLQPRMLLLGFLLHRAFDISKIPPLNSLERLPAGWGIMADDFGAAAYSCAVLHLLRYLTGW